MSVRKLAGTNNINREHLKDACGMTYAMILLSGRWKLKILYKLSDLTLRFGEIKQQIPNISDRMLTLHLKELEEDGFIVRNVFAEVPPKVEYRLTESALQLIPIWKQLDAWGDAHKANLDIKNDSDKTPE